MINRRTFTLFSMCAAAGVSGLANAQAAKKPKILVVYFSKTNHTKNIADTIARLTGADELRVEVVKPYPEAYRPTTQIVKEELEKGIVREIKAPEVDLSKYDVIIFGTPTWWHHVAMPLQTWIKAHPMQGKTIATYSLCSSLIFCSNSSFYFLNSSFNFGSDSLVSCSSCLCN